MRTVRLILCIVAGTMLNLMKSSAFSVSTRRRMDPLLKMSLLDDFTSKASVDSMLSNAMNRASSTLKTKEEYYKSQLKEEELPRLVAEPKGIEPTNKSKNNYAGNPCVHFTTLAHLQWDYVLRPGVDAAIDATCGNGHDSAYLADKLFSSSDGPGDSRLYCIDIQPEACQATLETLHTKLDRQVMDHHVQVLQMSHSPLVKARAPLALVCWNLGYLPKSVDKSTYTQMESTINSIADAALEIRVGGLLSIMTYPKTNANEDFAVHALFECMALLTSVNKDWRDYLEELGPDLDGDASAFTVKETVSKAMYRIYDHGDDKQTWRAMEHNMMGRDLSPIYLTATRVK